MEEIKYTKKRKEEIKEERKKGKGKYSLEKF